MATVSEASSSSSPVTKLLPQNSTGSGTSSTSTSTEENQTAKPKMPEFYWMVKPCFVYKDEYKDCKSFGGKFHQYFVEGKTADCSQWKEDYDNCELWKKTEDVEALKKVIEGEKSRLKHRLRAHYANDVWEHRSSPPPDWNKELPDPIKKSYEATLLKQKADGLKSGKEKLSRLAGGDPHDLEDDTSCSIV